MLHWDRIDLWKRKKTLRLCSVRRERCYEFLFKMYWFEALWLYVSEMNWNDPSVSSELCRMQKSINCRKRLLASSSVCPSAWNNSDPSGRMWTKLDIWGVFRNSVEKIVVSLNPTRITSTLHEDVSTFMTISRWILLRMRNISNEVQTIRRHILCSITFHRKSFSLWDNVENMVESERSQMTI
jgi:hypothetical protein